MTEKILIVDDDLETLRLVGLMLQRQGYQVIAGHNGAEAIANSAKQLPDLIVLDLMMPDMDGYQVTRMLRAKPETANTPILMFTAKSQVDDKVAGYEAGVDDYLTKPVHPAELVAHIKALLSRSKARTVGTVTRGHVVGFLSAKGGLGVSTLALSTALMFHQKTKKEVIAAEVRPGQGTWAMEMGLNSSEGLASLLRLKSTEISHAAVENQLFRTTYGLRLLLASPRAKDCELMSNKAQMEEIVRQCSLLASLLVIDIGTPFLPYFDILCNLCDEMVVLTEPQPTAINKTKILLDDISEKGFGKSKLLTLVVVNRVRSDIQVSAARIQEVLGTTIDMVIPPAPEQSYQAAIKSVPMTQIQPEGLVAQQISRMTDSLIERLNK